MGFPCRNWLKILNSFLLLSIIKAQETCVTPDLQNGYCVPYSECSYVTEVSKKLGNASDVTQKDSDHIKKSRCSTNNQPLRLCCTISKPDKRYTPDLDYNRDFESQLNNEGLNILKGFNCGKSEGIRVLGGEEPKLGAYPWMAMLQTDGPDKDLKCGGSLITDRIVLIAAHCVQAAYPITSVRLGEHDLTTNPDCRQQGRKIVCNPPIEDIGVAETIKHPNYNSRYRINDIALLKLNRRVQFQRHIKPVCLPITTASIALNSDILYITGWGTTENSLYFIFLKIWDCTCWDSSFYKDLGPIHNVGVICATEWSVGTKSNVLLRAEVTRRDNSVCQDFFPTININQKHMCAGDLETGRDNCKGDSGGPLVGFNMYTDFRRFIQYGIVASGNGECNLAERFPSIYTNITTYMPWITNNIV